MSKDPTDQTSDSRGDIRKNAVIRKILSTTLALTVALALVGLGVWALFEIFVKGNPDAFFHELEKYG